jgi:isoamylase
MTWSPTIRSWNCGVEGPTDNPEVEALRSRQIKNFFGVNLLSVGAPMILMGDEVRRTQFGNNNAYCQDNETTWFDWSLVPKHQGLFRFVKSLISIRIKRDMAQEQFGMSLQQLFDQRLITWRGVNLNEPDWSENSHTIAFTVQSLSGNMAMHFMVNAYSESLGFEIPNQDENGSVSWKRLIDTSLESPDDICLFANAQEVTSPKYHVNSRSMVVLVNLTN